MDFFKLYHLPFLIVAIVMGTTFVTFYLSYFQYEHVTYILPYISDTGTWPPESCIFGQGLNVVACFLAFAMYIKYRQVQEIYQKHHIGEKYQLNKVTFIIGIFASIGISLVGNFQETNVFAVHWTGSVLAFGGGSVYECLQSLIYIKISPVIGQRKTTMFRIVLSLISLITFIIFTVTGFISYSQFTGDDMTKWTEQDGGFDTHLISTNVEWVCASSNMIYILLFYPEFREINLKPLELVLEEHPHKMAPNNVTIAY